MSLVSTRLFVLAAVFVCASPARANADLFADAKRVVILGDSITYSGQYLAYIEAYLRVATPDRKIEFLNLGLPSETVSGQSEPGHAGGRFPRPDLHERLDRILLQTKPDLVIACYGMNCGIYHPYSSERFQAFQDGIVRLRSKAIAAGARIVHLTPPTFDPEPVRDRTLPAGQPEYRQMYVDYNEVLDLYSAWLLAQRGRGWTVIDVHGPMNAYLAAQRAVDARYKLAGDGVHANDTGHWLIAREVLRQCDAPEKVTDAESADEMLAALGQSPDLVKLVQKKQRLLSDAWLNAVGHLRPGMAPGLPVDEATSQAAEIDRQIAATIK